jgi:hypothetical protein
VAARHRSQREAGECDHLTRAGASVGKGEAISILGSVEEVAEGAVDGAVKLGRLR